MSREQKRVAWPLLTLLLLAVASVLLVRARSQVISPPTAPSDQQHELNSTTVQAEVPGEKRTSPIESAQPDQGATKTRGPVQMVRFTLFDQGIYPREIRVRQGLVSLAIEDKTDGSSGLVVEREVGNQRLTQVRRSENHKRGRELISLTPGRYIVSDDSRPGNKASLVVQP